MELRKVSPSDDFDAISRIYALSWKEAYRHIVPQHYLDQLSESRWSNQLREGLWESYVMLDGTTYAGTSSVCPARDANMPGWGEVISIYLLPEYFGRGFGRPLLQHSVSALYASGYQDIYLWVLEKNRRARSFYEKNGFTLTSKQMTVTIGGQELTEVQYALHIEPAGIS